MSDGNASLKGPKPGFFGCIRDFMCRQWRLLAVFVVGGVLGLGAFGTWVTIIEHTNHTEFCINCHIMRDTVYVEYQKSAHYQNKHGVRAGCPDCHVPQYSWFDEALAKVDTIGELYSFFVEGKNDAAALEKDRAKLAKQVWAKFAATNARECKHCHSYAGMILEEQKTSAKVSHIDAGKKDANCVECHKGLTHKPVQSDATVKDSDSFDVE